MLFDAEDSFASAREVTGRSTSHAAQTQNNDIKDLLCQVRS
jgi:hypothetical protein